MNNRLNLFFLCLFFCCCKKTHTIRAISNEKKGSLIATYELKFQGEKKFLLDSVTAPKPFYTQMIALGRDRYFTMLNNFDNAIYFYNYESLKFVKKLTFNKKDLDVSKGIIAYYIKNLDSIYLYNSHKIELVLVNEKSSIQSKILLKREGNPKTWFANYPQYYPQTANSFIGIPGKLLIIGQDVHSIPESKINTFKFTFEIDLHSEKVKFISTYPESLYGSDSNWGVGLFTQVFSELYPSGNSLIYSFPVSHDLYIAPLDGKPYTKVFGGSNTAGTISSIDEDPNKKSGGKVMLQYLRQDVYTAIKYDAFRKVYYRFLLKGIPNATLGVLPDEKPVCIIIMDEKFKYLGETTIGSGKEWYWRNCFVTAEGLNIEYIPKNGNESFLNLKVFTIKKI